MPGLNQMTSASSAGASVITLQFSLNLSLDVAEQEVQAAINAANNLLPADLPAPPIYAKVNPADAPIMTLAVTSDDAAADGARGHQRDAARAENLAAARRRARRISGGQRPAVRIQIQPAGARRLWAQHRRCAHHHQQRQRQYAEGRVSTARMQASTINANDQLTSVDGLRERRHRLSQRRAGAAVGCRQRRQRRRKHQARAPGPTPRRRSSSTCSASRAPMSSQVVDGIKKLLPTLQAEPAGGRRCQRAQRPHDDDPRLGRRCRVRAGARHRAGRAGDLPLPAQSAGDAHPEPFGAAVAGRHARRRCICSASASTICR